MWGFLACMEFLFHLQKKNFSHTNIARMGHSVLSHRRNLIEFFISSFVRFKCVIFIIIHTHSDVVIGGIQLLVVFAYK